ncbi:uncharacterized protein FFB20_09228 [Fusarium fujikuroi]|nr:uncharacterized protein FFC1_03242 [Fusarium fujikuroi]SCN92505.1 uncharacterized protein FFB20_09228 [Fusarium fujikuroi]SCO04353.1 uncharacterized protein FFE2_10597 [Fusarium fujikuroi]SCO06832.1 uncharacterized protein FFM5_08865 [Fusarium fujikuroi]SCO32123.1 uncharacterized protein FFNC_02699 [Fusarium fujikuroi]
MTVHWAYVGLGLVQSLSFIGPVRAQYISSAIQTDGVSEPSLICTYTTRNSGATLSLKCCLPHELSGNHELERGAMSHATALTPLLFPA